MPGSRLAVRNWRVRTRLYAILLIPVVVGLVFGGFRVQDSIDTWNEAEDAQRTAELVRAAADYGNALIDERDRTAAPLLAGRRNDPAVGRARDVTDRAKKDFDRAVTAMPDKPGLERRLAVFREGGAQARRPARRRVHQPSDRGARPKRATSPSSTR